MQGKPFAFAFPTGRNGIHNRPRGRRPQGKGVPVEITITIEGVTPLICNKFTDAAAMSATTGTRSAAIGDKGSPMEQARQKLYTSADGERFTIPQPNLFRAIIDAGKFHKAGKSKVTTQKSSIIPACVDLHGSEIDIIHNEPWQVDTRAVRIPSTGGRILAHRPRFDDWRLTFTVTLDTSVMSERTFRDILDDAGSKIGLGDFRPDCKGPFGKFKVTAWVREEVASAA